MRKGFSLLLFILVFTSCIINKQVGISSNASIGNSNFKFVSTCSGSSSAFYVIGIGGFDNEGLMSKAKRDLYYNASVKDNQVIANISYDEIYKYFYPIFYEHKIIVIGDLIEFTDNNQKTTMIKADLNKENSTIQKELNGFKTGDIVLFNRDGKMIEGIISDIINGFAIIEYSSNNETKTTDRSINEIKKKE